MDAVGGRSPVIVGVTSTSLAEIRESMEEGDCLEVSGCLVPPPFYFSNSTDGVCAFFRGSPERWIAKSWSTTTQLDEHDHVCRPDRLLPLFVELLLGPDQYPAVVKPSLLRLGVISNDGVLPLLTLVDFRRRAEIAAVFDGNVFDKDA